MIDENEMRNRAEKWLDLDGTTAGPVTRENALAEDMMALDVLDLLAECERLRKLVGEACDVGMSWAYLLNMKYDDPQDRYRLATIRHAAGGTDVGL